MDAGTLSKGTGMPNMSEMKAQREPTFEELQPEEQIKRLRLEIIMLREVVNSQQALIDRLMVHAHAADGQLMVPMSRSGGGAIAGRRDPLR